MKKEKLIKSLFDMVKKMLSKKSDEDHLCDVGDEEKPYISMMLPQFHEIKDGQETLVLAVCNKLTCELKLVKVYVDQTFKNVNATSEFFYANNETLKRNLRNSLQMLVVVGTVFRKDLAALSDE
jgi:hypothetical protein